MSKQKCIHPGDDEHLKKLGLQRGSIQQWEDGLRTHGGSGSYEWWYFDSHLDDGSILVVTFFTKQMTEPNKPLEPFVSLEFTTPDGTTISQETHGTPENCVFAKDRCHVEIKGCLFEGDLHTYHIKVVGDRVNVDLQLTGTVPAWRSQCGEIYFGDNEEYNFCWLPAVPEGDVKATITVDGQTKEYTGTGYHDHNWGNVSMMAIMHHWYWGRAKIGPYSVISSNITAEKKYGYTDVGVFMLAKDGKLVGENENNSYKFCADDIHYDPITNKPVHSFLKFEYTNDDGRKYVITYRKERTLVSDKLINRVTGFKKALAKIAGFDGAYMRFAGVASIDCIKDGEVVEHYENPAVWELMYFGKNRVED